MRLDPDAVLTTARRAHVLRRAAAAMSVAAVAVSAVFAVSHPGSPGQGPSLARGTPTLSALSHRVSLGPLALLMLRDQSLRYPGQGSLVGSLGADRVYLVEAANGDVCVIEVSESFGTGIRDCQPTSDLLTTGIVSTTNYAPEASAAGTDLHVLVVTPDGYTSASSGGRQAAIHDNLAIVPLPAPKPTSVRVNGPGVPTLTFSPVSR